jgi:hypothetical protein
MDSRTLSPCMGEGAMGQGRGDLLVPTCLSLALRSRLYTQASGRAAHSIREPHPASVTTRFTQRSTSTWARGPRMAVDSRSSTTAGPVRRWPITRISRKPRVVIGPAFSPRKGLTWRRCRPWRRRCRRCSAVTLEQLPAQACAFFQHLGIRQRLAVRDRSPG